MSNLKKTAAAIALASAAAFAASPASAGSKYYPEYPEAPETPSYNNSNSNKNNNHNDISNYNKNNNSNTQGQHQGQNQGQNQSQNAYGGQGGKGGQGGSAHSNSNANADSHAHSSSNATGGAANSNATGGSSSAQGGASNSGGNSMNMSNNYDAPKPMGNVAATTIIPAGNCGEGWALNLSIPFFGAGGGKTSQNQFCLSQEAAKTAINAGLVAKDTGMVATGLAALRGLHPEFDAAANTVVANLMKPCAAQASKISAIMLTQNDLQCNGEYVKGTENFIRSLQAASAPVQPIRVEVVNPVRVDGTVSTKEVARPAPVRRAAAPAPAPKPKAPCGC